MSVSILAVIVVTALSSYVIEHRSVLSVTVALATHLIHVVPTILRVLLTVGIWVSVRISTVRALAMMHLM